MRIQANHPIHPTIELTGYSVAKPPVSAERTTSNNHAGGATVLSMLPGDFQLTKRCEGKYNVANVINGLFDLHSLSTLLLIIFGTGFGMVIGVIPGLGVLVALVVLLPFLYHMDVTDGIGIMLSTQAGSYYAASITAILLNTPGAPESYPTTLDGYPMTQQGLAGRALAISAVATAVGAIIAGVAFLGLMNVAPSIIVLIKPPEYIGLIVMAMAMVSKSGTIKPLKAIASVGMGFMLSFVGIDSVTGVYRFTLGSNGLASGISLAATAMGVFAISQMILFYGQDRQVQQVTGSETLKSQIRSQMSNGVKEAVLEIPGLLRSAIVAVLLGLVPGIGGFTANYISYNLGERFSKHRKQYGLGCASGIVSAEGSSLAKEIGSLVPAITLGVPSGLGMVIFIAALSILGVEPGLTLLKQHASLPYQMMWVLVLSGCLSCVIGLIVAPYLIKIANVPGKYMLPFITLLCFLGAYASEGDSVVLIVLVLAAAAGIMLRKYGYSIAAILVGMILGRLLDSQAQLTREVYGWSFVWRQPLADVFIVFAVIWIIAKRPNRADRVDVGLDNVTLEEENSKTGAEDSAGFMGTIEDNENISPSQKEDKNSNERHLRNVTHFRVAASLRSLLSFRSGQLYWYLIIIMISCLYFVTAYSYPFEAGFLPMTCSAVVVCVSIIECLSTAKHKILNPIKGITHVKYTVSNDSVRVLDSEDRDLAAMQEHLVDTTEHSGLTYQLQPIMDISDCGTSGDKNNVIGLEFRRCILVKVGRYSEKIQSRLSNILAAQAAREMTAMAWVILILVLVFVFGFEIGLPIGLGVYGFGLGWAGKRLRIRIVATAISIVIALLAVLGFIMVFHLTLNGLLVAP